jgi:geranylgeranyl diphosphate synthase type II
MSFEAWGAIHTPRVNEALDWFCPDVGPLREAMRYSLMAGGKRIRPLLCIGAIEAVGGDPEVFMPLPAALEMIHTFSLIHDDLPALDNDDLRRGLPTCHVKYGEALAILAGDALQSLAFEVVARSLEAAPERKVDILLMLGEACTHMVFGQTADIAAERRTDVSLNELKSIHSSKTGALLHASICTGARAAGANAAQMQALSRYGKTIGIAFQIVDDILDVTGDDATLGKPAGSDLKHDKATYPKLVGLDESKRLARAAEQEALVALEIFGESAEPLREIARYIVERNT